MAKVTLSVNRSFWKVAGLVDAVDADEPGVGEILDLRRDNEVKEITNKKYNKKCHYS